MKISYKTDDFTKTKNLSIYQKKNEEILTIKIFKKIIKF